MNRRWMGFWFVGLALLSFAVTGCGSSSSSSSGDAEAESGSPEESGSTEIVEKNWEAFPDVAKVDIMAEVDGIPIPRAKRTNSSLQIEGELPVDVGNPTAEEGEKPAYGGRLTIRFDSEPKSLNPIVESSAVQTYICLDYVNESLAERNKETLKREPKLAEKWVVEDSIKLAADFLGAERKVSFNGADGVGELEATYPEITDEDNPPVINFMTLDGESNALGNVWVGLFPQEDSMIGAPKSGYHYWSEPDGNLDVSNIVPGKYLVRVGAEMAGESTVGEDGKLTVKSLTKANAEPVALSKDQYVDVQRQTIFTYYLDPKAKWSDGTPLTTKDIEFAYATINNPFVDGEAIRVYYQDLIRCDAIDERTVTMQYRQQYFQAIDYTADITTIMPPWHAFEGYFKEQGKELTLEKLTPEQETAQNKISAHGQVFGKFFNTDPRYNETPLGTGPFKVTKWVRDDRVELNRNPDYWDDEHGGYLDTVVVKFISDNVTAFQALKSGEIDFFYRMDAAQYFEDLAGPPAWFKDKFVKADWYTPGYGYVGWNSLNPLFQDRRVRIALALLFDVEEFVEKKVHGAATLVSGSQYFFGPAYDHEVEPIGYDAETARDLLAEAGWSDTDNDGVLDKDDMKFEFTFLLVPGKQIPADRAALMQKSYESAGIKMNIQQFEWASFLEKIKSKEYDVVSLAWASDPESDPYQLWHSSGAGRGKRSSNHTSFDNKEADAIIEQIRETLDEEKRMLLNASLHRILDREQPYMFLYNPKEFGAYNVKLHGVKWYRIRPGFDLREWYIPKKDQQE